MLVKIIKLKTWRKYLTLKYIKLTANHLGWFEFRLCNADALFAQGKDADQDCLNQNLLRDQFGNSRMIATPGIGSTFNYKLILPMNLLCNRCVFQVC